MEPQRKFNVSEIRFILLMTYKTKMINFFLDVELFKYL